MITLLLSTTFTAQAGDLPDEFHAAAVEFQVPEKVLLALAYEASHWRVDAASAWGGYGLFDFREDDGRADIGGPDVERSAILVGLSPDDLIHQPRQNVRAAAALLAWQGRLSHGGELPPTDDLLEWWDAVVAFSGRQEPELQTLYAAYVYEQINFGVELDEETGLSIVAEPVDHWNRAVPPPPTSCDYSGCDQFVAASSSNYSDYSRTAADIDYIVIHTVQGSYSGCISWFQNSSSQVSAHYVVRSSDGAVTQMVKEEDVAWHAGNWSYNLASVGIEHEGYVDAPETWYTDAMYQGSAALSADIVARNGISLDRTHILGHVEVPGATHTDPGDGWDWDYYMELIGGGSGPSTGDVIGVVADTDIYNGARLTGARVWVEQTGEQTSSDETGYYHIYDLPLDTYTIHACADGYIESTCSKSLSTGDNWCSIALTPGDTWCSLDGDDTGSDTGDDTGPVVDTGDSGDSGEETGEPDVDTGGPSHNGRPGQPPGKLVATSEVGGCGCASAPERGVALAWLAALGALLIGRRRH